MIAHRLSTIRRADVIFVVKDGAIIESGKHEELLSSGGLHSELGQKYCPRQEDTERGRIQVDGLRRDSKLDA